MSPQPYADASSRSSPSPTGSFHDVWYPDYRTEVARVRLARDAGVGIGVWRLGREDQRLWDDPLLAP